MNFSKKLRDKQIIDDILKICKESRKRMNSYTQAEREILYQRALKTMKGEK